MPPLKNAQSRCRPTDRGSAAARPGDRRSRDIVLAVAGACVALSMIALTVLAPGGHESPGSKVAATAPIRSLMLMQAAPTPVGDIRVVATSINGGIIVPAGASGVLADALRGRDNLPSIRPTNKTIAPRKARSPPSKTSTSPQPETSPAIRARSGRAALARRRKIRNQPVPTPSLAAESLPDQSINANHQIRVDRPSNQPDGTVIDDAMSRRPAAAVQLRATQRLRKRARRSALTRSGVAPRSAAP